MIPQDAPGQGGEQIKDPGDHSAQTQPGALHCEQYPVFPSTGTARRPHEDGIRYFVDETRQILDCLGLWDPGSDLFQALRRNRVTGPTSKWRPSESISLRSFGALGLAALHSPRLDLLEPNQTDGGSWLTTSTG